MYRSILMTCAVMAPLALPVHSAEPRPSVEQLEQNLDAAMKAYSDCVVKAASTMASDLTQTPESIADKGHESCGNLFGKATDAALFYTVAMTPKSGTLSAITFASKQMDEYKAVVRKSVINIVLDKRKSDAA
jgi:hypothetical protein